MGSLQAPWGLQGPHGACRDPMGPAGTPWRWVQKLWGIYDVGGYSDRQTVGTGWDVNVWSLDPPAECLLSMYSHL